MEWKYNILPHLGHSWSDQTLDKYMVTEAAEVGSYVARNTHGARIGLICLEDCGRCMLGLSCRGPTLGHAAYQEP